MLRPEGNEKSMKLNVKAFYLPFDVRSEIILMLDFFPVAGGGFIDADEIKCILQADHSFAVIMADIIVDMIIHISVINLEIVIDWLLNVLFGVLFTNIFTFHVSSPF